MLEDWIWHTALPFIAYLTLLSGSLALVLHPREALFAIGATSILLLFIGIHNAWDTVTYITVAYTAATKQTEVEDRPPQ